MVDRILRDRYQIQRQLGKRIDQETLLALARETNELVVVKLLIFNHDLIGLWTKKVNLRNIYAN